MKTTVTHTFLEELAHPSKGNKLELLQDQIEVQRINHKVPIDIQNFFSLQKYNDLERNREKNALLIFVDGGNAELVSGSGMSLQKIRMGIVVYDNKKRVMRFIEDGDLLVRVKKEDKSVFYEGTFQKRGQENKEV